MPVRQRPIQVAMTPSFSPLFAIPHWRRGFRFALAALLAGAAQWAVAQGSGYDRVQQLIDAQDWPQALQVTNQQLGERPQDPQLRFMKGLIETQQGQTDAALATFTALTRDYPELPDPHNNLAVLHAGAGRLTQARAALETALQLNPKYAVAHRNLGDVYLQLAAQAYRTSLNLRADAPGLAQRLQRVEALQIPAR